MSKIKNISYDLYNIENIKYSKYLIKDCSAKKKEFVQDKSKDDAIQEICLKKGVTCFRGSEQNVLERVLRAAEGSSIQNIVELHGDNPFLDPQLIDESIKIFMKGHYDYLTNTLKKTFPQGTRIQIFPTKKLKEVSEITSDPSVQEHVSLYFYENPSKYKIFNLEANRDMRRPELRLTVDTIEDFNFIESIYKRIEDKKLKPNFSIKEVIKIIDENNLKILNRDISSKPVR